jgi:hypothetical protein
MVSLNADIFHGTSTHSVGPKSFCCLVGSTNLHIRWDLFISGVNGNVGSRQRPIGISPLVGTWTSAGSWRCCVAVVFWMPTIAL